MAPKETARQKHNRLMNKLENLSKVMQASKAMQMRFKLIPTKALNKVTVAGVRDMNLGRVGKDGKPVGGNVLRFNNKSPNTKSDFTRICIDPKGVSNKNNPHIPVSAGTVKAAQNIQKGLKVTGKALLIVSIVASGIRIAKAIYDEVDIDSEIEALEEVVDCLEEDLRKGDNTAETKEALKFAETLLEDARDCKRNPGKKTVLTSLCIGGEWVGAAALGFAGAQTGAAIGSVGGPIGAIGGAVTGSVIGAIAGSELGQSAVENFHCDENGIGTELQGNLLDFGTEDHAQVLSLDGTVQFGNEGFDIGAGGALFKLENDDENKSLVLGKTGVNFGITEDKGVDVGLEGKAIWTEVESKNMKVGFGLNVDTGLKANERNFEASFLGIGFSAGEDGIGFKLPFLNMKWKK